MTKRIVSVFLLFFLAFTAFADPTEDMTIEEAATLVSYLKDNPYIVDYCDCCDDLKPGGERVYAKLILVEKAEIIPCTYSPEKFSVILHGTVVAGGIVNEDGRMTGVEIQGYAYELDNGEPALAALNYHFAYQNGKVVRLGKVVEVNQDYACNPLHFFPSHKELGDFGIPYKSFLDKNK